ncbi:MAG: rod shape-determining protein MreD [Acidobacteriaceae bacterium]|jgi:rod shape-determining protein MreD|nr:rod shape-determining protein MreD [Acidobacteriaceae bacterium]
MAMNSTLTRHENETTFHPVVLVVVPILALILQVYVPHLFPHFVLLDLPLLVVIYFAITLRGPIAGTLAGMLIGLVQDAQTGHPIGVNGMAKSIIGYAAASIGVRIDVENTVSRMLLTAVFTLANSILIYIIERRLLGFDAQWMWLHETARIVANALVSVVLFWVLDRLRRKG